jgi:hypothetical protein
MVLITCCELTVFPFWTNFSKSIPQLSSTYLWFRRKLRGLPDLSVATSDMKTYVNYSMRMPEIAQAITSCSISDVPSKMGWIVA